MWTLLDVTRIMWTLLDVTRIMWTLLDVLIDNFLKNDKVQNLLSTQPQFGECDAMPINIARIHMLLPRLYSHTNEYNTYQRR
jgi:hypothetical protein